MVAVWRLGFQKFLARLASNAAEFPGRLLGVLAQSDCAPDWFDPDARALSVDFRGVLAVLRRVYRAYGLAAELT